MAELPAMVALAREALHHLALDLVVSEHAWNQIVTKEKKKVGEALCGGGVVPVPSLDKQEGYVVPHQSSEVVSERLLEPTVTWGIHSRDEICLIACEEFIVVRRRSLPFLGLTFSF